MAKRTVSELVKALGGTSAVAELMKVGPTSVSNAKAVNQIPESWKYRLSKIVRKRRLRGFWRLFDTEPATRRARANDNNTERPNTAA